jgi:hypothetical protein
VGVEITVNLQIDRVYAALRTPAPLQSLLNITVLGAVGIGNSTILTEPHKQRHCSHPYGHNHYEYYRNTLRETARGNGATSPWLASIARDRLAERKDRDHFSITIAPNVRGQSMEFNLIRLDS